MILTLDIGNTTIVVCGVEPAAGYRVVFSGKLPASRNPNDGFQDLEQLLRRTGTAPEDIDGAPLSSVEPSFAF